MTYKLDPSPYLYASGDLQPERPDDHGPVRGRPAEEEKAGGGPIRPREPLVGASDAVRLDEGERVRVEVASEGTGETRTAVVVGGRLRTELPAPAARTPLEAPLKAPAEAGRTDATGQNIVRDRDYLKRRPPGDVEFDAEAWEWNPIPVPAAEQVSVASGDGRALSAQPQTPAPVAVSPDVVQRESIPAGNSEDENPYVYLPPPEDATAPLDFAVVVTNTGEETVILG